MFRLDCHPDDDEGVESSRVRHLRFGATEAELGDGEDGCDAEATPEIGFSDLATRMLNMRSRVARSLNIYQHLAGTSVLTMKNATQEHATMRKSGKNICSMKKPLCLSK